MKKQKKLSEKFELWLDRVKMAILGTKFALRKKSYLLVALISWVGFLYLLTMFKNGTALWAMLWSGLDFGEKIGVLFGVWEKVLANFLSLDGVLLIILTFLQGVAIGLLIFVWKKKEKSATKGGIESGSIGAALSFLALGCPSCGISLFSPILTAIAGTGALVLADSLGWIFLALSFVFLFSAIKKMGYAAFIIETARRYYAKN